MGSMKPLLATLVLLMVLSMSPARAADPLEALQGKSRPLLLFAKSRSDASLEKQLELLRSRRSDLSERDMLVLVSEGDEDTIAAIGYTPVPAGANRDLRARFLPSTRGLVVILVGKDGDEKARWDKPVDPDEIFALIDAMPMRQREMGAATN